MQPFKLRGSEVTEGGMFAFVEVVMDVLFDLSTRRSTVLVFGHFEFRLEGSKTRFHEGVVVAVAGAAHALTEFCAAQDGPVTYAGVLPSAVCVMDEARGRLSLADRHGERRKRESVGHRLVQLPADQGSREAVHEH